MTSILDCLQAVSLVIDNEIDWRRIIEEKQAVRGVKLVYGQEHIIINSSLRSHDGRWLSNGHPLSADTCRAITEWSLKVIAHYGAKRNSKRTLGARGRSARRTPPLDKTITEWSIHYVDPRTESADAPHHAQ